MNNVHVTVFLVSLKAGGVALNLTEASRVYLMDSWWNPAVEYRELKLSEVFGYRRSSHAQRQWTASIVWVSIVPCKRSSSSSRTVSRVVSFSCRRRRRLWLMLPYLLMTLYVCLVCLGDHY